MKRTILTCRNVFIGSAILLAITTLTGGLTSLTYFGIGLVAGAMAWMFGSVANLFGQSTFSPSPLVEANAAITLVTGFGSVALSILVTMIIIAGVMSVKTIWFTNPVDIALAQIAALCLGLSLGAVLGKWRMA